MPVFTSPPIPTFAIDGVMGKPGKKTSDRRGSYSGRRFLQHPMPFP